MFRNDLPLRKTTVVIIVESVSVIGQNLMMKQLMITSEYDIFKVKVAPITLEENLV